MNLQLKRKLRYNVMTETIKTFDQFFDEQLKDPEFRKEWEYLQPERNITRAMLDTRISHDFTRKELSEYTGISLTDISKLENGTRNPSLKLLKRLADGMGMTLKIEFVPKEVVKGR